MNGDDVRGLAALMREVGATRARWGDLELTLGPVPVAPLPVTEDKPEPPPACACGHEWATEHNEAGCMLGCSLERCSGTADKVAEA